MTDADFILCAWCEVDAVGTRSTAGWLFLENTGDCCCSSSSSSSKDLITNAAVNGQRTLSPLQRDFTSRGCDRRSETRHSHSCSHWQNFSQKFWVITHGQELSQGWSGWSHGW